MKLKPGTVVFVTTYGVTKGVVYKTRVTAERWPNDRRVYVRWPEDEDGTRPFHVEHVFETKAQALEAIKSVAVRRRTQARRVVVNFDQLVADGPVVYDVTKAKGRVE